MSVQLPYDVPTVPAVIGLVVWIVFVIRYHLSTRGAWRDSQVGWNIMNSSFLIIGFLAITTATRLTANGDIPEPFPGQRIAATLVYGLAVFSGIQRIVLQYRAQPHKDR